MYCKVRARYCIGGKGKVLGMMAFSTGKGLGLRGLKARDVRAYTQTYGHALWGILNM